ncbi:hypothetical protein LNP74_17895 [Klebsiella pneumoniae subsp. pneumoniae]|nr:hypothetical protein [Klebsiella pneumoniae subsp. pneumoniae]
MINQLVTFGGEWRHDKLKDPVNLSSGGQSTSASQYALFIEDEWRIIEAAGADHRHSYGRPSDLWRSLEPARLSGV